MSCQLHKVISGQLNGVSKFTCEDSNKLSEEEEELELMDSVV